MLNVNQILDAFFIAVTGWTFVMVLMPPKRIFHFWQTIVNKIEDSKSFVRHFAKPLGTCEVCFSGQISLWFFIVENWNGYDINSFVSHIVFMSITMFFTEIMSRKL